MSTPAPTTPAPTTCPDPDNGFTVEASAVFKASSRTVLVRAWVENFHRTTVRTELTPARCFCSIMDEAGVVVLQKAGSSDPAGGQFVRFEFSAAQLAAQHGYIMEIAIYGAHCDVRAWRRMPLPTVN